MIVCLALLGGCSGDEDKDASKNPAAGDNGGANGNTGNNGGDNGGATSDPSGEEDPTPITEGCKGQKLREGISDDPGEPGPWPVGAVTTTLGGIPAEVWYPAKQGSQVGKKLVSYDIREHLPDADFDKIPEANNPTQACDCYRDLPLDEEAGPYPVILFIHGTAGFRTTNLDNATHWASRGFVVIAGDHPGIRLKDMLGAASLGGGGGGAADQTGDGRRMLEELAKTAGDVAFLKGHIDMDRVGALGHSAGGGAVSNYGDIADVIVIYAAGSGISDPTRATSMMSLMGSTDNVAGAGTAGYDSSTTATKRFVSITKGGHLVGGNLCTLRDPTDPNKDIVDLAEEYKLGGLLGQLGLVRQLFGQLFDGCNDPMDDPKGKFIAATRGIEVMNYVTAGVFEETLHCADRAGALSDTEKEFGGDIAEYLEVLP
jgi:hypothetical protein